jgi:hypothetical protein
MELNTNYENRTEKNQQEKMTPKEKLIIELIFIACILIVAVIFWILGFSNGLNAGILECSKIHFESCGFYYDYATNTYSKDLTQIKINLTLFINETS